MAKDLEEVAESVRAGTKAFGTRYLTRRLEWLRPYPVGVRVASILALQQANWSGLRRKAAEYRREAAADLKGIRQQQADLVQLTGDVAELEKAARRSWKKPKDREEWPEIEAGLVKKLRQKHFTPQQIEEGVAKFAGADADDLIKPLKASLAVYEHQLNACATMRFSALAAADLADAVATVNNAVRRSTSPKKPAADLASTAIDKLLASLKALQAALHSGRSSSVLAKSRQCETVAGSQIDRLVEAMAYWIRLGDRTGDAEPARKGVPLADAMRLALLALSAARVAAWKVSLAEASTERQLWVKSAAKSFASAYDPPGPKPLADVVHAPTSFDGKRITIEGLVGPVAIVHRGPEKVISTSSLSDGRGAVVSVGLTYIKLDSGGLVPGCFASLTGTFIAQGEEFSGPTLQIERRNLTDDSKTSWLDWLQLKLLPIVTPTPHALGGRWSWVAGANGPGNPLRYGTWSDGRRVF
jgi:hypothetical protein